MISDKFPPKIAFKVEYRVKQGGDHLVRFSGKFEVWTFDNGIDRACFLAEATVDAFGHVNIIPAHPNQGQTDKK